jgi:NADPH:quinone reductase-like Zn-dependent oxidoreductase
MKAFIVDHYGKGSVPRATEIAVPEIGDHDVLVRIRAAGVNPLDAKIIEGEFKQILPYRTPFTIGNDMAGVVERVGDQVANFAVGDEVYARPDKDRIGTFAEYIAVNAADLAHKPSSLSMAEAASLPLVALTAWQALVEMAEVQPGQRVLIHAGSGGVGTIAIQLAKRLGAHVATTASASNAPWLHELGADVVVDYRTQDFAQALHDYDVVLDSLGAENTLRSLQMLRPGGIAISISGPPDPAFARQLGKPLLRPVMALLSLRVRAAARKRGVRYSFLFMQANGSQLGRITDLVEAGALKPVVDRIFAFDDAVAALGYVGTGRARGKVVLEMP